MKPSPANNTILIVENEPRTYESATQFFSEQGYTIISTNPVQPIATYAMAIELLKKHPTVKFVLLDVQLDSKETGFDVAIHLLKNKYNAHIVIYTALYGSDTKKAARRLGLTYPVEKVDFASDYEQCHKLFQYQNLPVDNLIEFKGNTLFLKVFTLPNVPTTPSEFWKNFNTRKSDHETMRIDISEIVCIKTREVEIQGKIMLTTNRRKQEGYCFITLKSGTVLASCCTLSALANQLPTTSFIQVNDHTIINILFFNSFLNIYQITMLGLKHPLKLSRTKARAIKNSIQVLFSILST
jgi:DNA-binding LytR/AlgR family response regulator